MKLQRISPEKIIELVTEYHLSGKQDRHILGKSVADAQLSSDKAKLKRLLRRLKSKPMILVIYKFLMMSGSLSKRNG